MDNFSHIYTDTKNRRIEIGHDDDDTVIAEYDGEEIGRFEFSMIDEDYDFTLFLSHMNIHPDFQRAGIGTELMKYAEELHGAFPIISHLSIEGAGLVNYCIKQGLFKENHILHNDDRF